MAVFHSVHGKIKTGCLRFVALGAPKQSQRVPLRLLLHFTLWPRVEDQNHPVCVHSRENRVVKDVKSIRSVINSGRHGTHSCIRREKLPQTTQHNCGVYCRSAISNTASPWRHLQLKRHMCYDETGYTRTVSLLNDAMDLLCSARGTRDIDCQRHMQTDVADCAYRTSLLPPCDSSHPSRSRKKCCGPVCACFYSESQ